MARIPDETDPMAAENETPMRSTTDERVIGSLLDGLDAPQPPVRSRSRSGKRARSGDSTPPLPAPGDRNAATALLPNVEMRRRRRRTFVAAFAGIALVLAAIASVSRVRSNTDATLDAPSTNVSISSNTQKNIVPTATPLTARTPLTTTAAPIPTPNIALSSLPAVTPGMASTATASARPHVAAPKPSASGTHAEIKEDTL